MSAAPFSLNALVGREGEDLSLYEAQAALWVETFLLPRCPDLAPGVVETITLYLAAHFASIAQVSGGQELQSAQRGDIRETYTTLGPNADTSGFLRTAAQFDPCGIIAELLGEKPLIAVFGRGYPNDRFVGRRVLP